MGYFVSKIDGATVSNLKIIPNPKGDILHALKKSDNQFNEFGEAYFSFVSKNHIKGWKKHKFMTLNIIVPIGEIQFFIYDDRENSLTKGMFFTVTLSKKNYKRLTIKPDLWVAFKGLSEQENMLLNIADIEHEAEESINVSIDEFPIP